MPQDIDLDKVFCMVSKKNRIEKLWLKAIAIVESNLDPKAYRFEPGFWERYLKNNPEWSDKDPKRVSASYGVMQLMYTTAWLLGFRGEPEDLWNPIYNIEYGAVLIRRHLNEIKTTTNVNLLPIEIATARYNGGQTNNPGPDGRLRNESYVKKVKAAYWKLLADETNCTD